MSNKIIGLQFNDVQHIPNLGGLTKTFPSDAGVQRSNIQGLKMTETQHGVLIEGVWQDRGRKKFLITWGSIAGVVYDPVEATEEAAAEPKSFPKPTPKTSKPKVNGTEE